jgi:glycosyltransferase involved in cell wall biosynthesis
VLELAIPNHVTFLGFVNDMPQHLANMDIYLNTSISDGSPISLLEAMAMKKAIVTTNVGGIPEWITHARSGLMYPARDVEFLSIGILSLYDPFIRKICGKNARADLLLKGGDFKKNMEAMERDYETLHNA